MNVWIFYLCLKCIFQFNYLQHQSQLSIPDSSTSGHKILHHFHNPLSFKFPSLIFYLVDLWASHKFLHRKHPKSCCSFVTIVTTQSIALHTSQFIIASPLLSFFLLKSIVKTQIESFFIYAVLNIGKYSQNYSSNNTIMVIRMLNMYQEFFESLEVILLNTTL